MIRVNSDKELDDGPWFNWRQIKPSAICICLTYPLNRLAIQSNKCGRLVDYRRRGKRKGKPPAKVLIPSRFDPKTKHTTNRRQSIHRQSNTRRPRQMDSEHFPLAFISCSFSWIYIHFFKWKKIKNSTKRERERERTGEQREKRLVWYRWREAEGLVTMALVVLVIERVGKYVCKLTD